MTIKSIVESTVLLQTWTVEKFDVALSLSRRVLVLSFSIDASVSIAITAHGLAWHRPSSQQGISVLDRSFEIHEVLVSKPKTATTSLK